MLTDPLAERAPWQHPLALTVTGQGAALLETGTLRRVGLATSKVSSSKPKRKHATDATNDVNGVGLHVHGQHLKQGALRNAYLGHHVVYVK